MVRLDPRARPVGGPLRAPALGRGGAVWGREREAPTATVAPETAAETSAPDPDGPALAERVRQLEEQLDQMRAEWDAFRAQFE